MVDIKIVGTSRVVFVHRFPMVIPKQSWHCVAWNALMLATFAVFIRVVPEGTQSGALWNVFVGMVALNVALSVRCVFTDPGYIPPVNRLMDDNSGSTQRPNPIVEMVDATYLDDIFSLNYCKTCKHLRPKNASHCWMCDVCVLNIDHHCQVLGCCIGERNAGAFVAYLFSVALSSAYGSVVLVVTRSDDESSIANPRTILFAAMFVIGLATACLVGGFAIYYSYLLLRGKTSKQFLTSKGDGSNAFGIKKLCGSLVMPKASLLGTLMDDWGTEPSGMKASLEDECIESTG
jgi:hypothetical protein